MGTATGQKVKKKGYGAMTLCDFAERRKKVPSSRRRSETCSKVRQPLPQEGMNLRGKKNDAAEEGGK